MSKAIVLLSGGLDSATTLYFAKSKGHDCCCLIFDYGQRHSREITSAKEIAKEAGCKFEVVNISLPWKGSSLLDNNMEICHSEDAKRPKNLKQCIPSTYVPARNIIFLSFALSYAEAIGAEAIFIGANAIDYSGYPDCRPEFFNAFIKTAELGTKTGSEGNPVKILTPLINMTKAQIISLGISLKVPYHLTWSCYKGLSRSCGECDSCRIREKGFRELGINDPALKIAKIHEIFTSIQGEGVFSGKMQLFIRFFGCNLRCAFCDTPQNSESVKDYSVDDLLSAVCVKARPESIHSVSLTGGEPLLQADFLKDFLPKLKQLGYRVYLETNGVMHAELANVIDYIDIVSMDIKLPSSTRLPDDFWKEHSKFLEISMQKQVFVKIIVTSDTTTADFSKAVFLIAQKDPHIALAIQPASPQQNTGAVSAPSLRQFENIACEHLCRVKIIPQMHKLYGVK